MKELFLLRGLPGAGKSTLAKSIGAKSIGSIHIEADQYFMENGVYKFDATKIKDAHIWCRHSVMDAMKHGFDKLIVSNTFTQEWEMDAYYLLAEEFGYRVFSLIVENRHNGINLHDCPADKIEAMKTRFEIKL
jgi:predicted kinase